ncbi:MAG: RNA 2',3'-cyclic phosphodiesterase [Abditibacteriales bacterium]|nr:RNA 2',3'-cyclic phosphodiesterase [Abditibacteriales bacterium]MDW8364546.1 RNA 2',3'-cyclic phosphodiesterase [Abditibacteriales bacterium]
MRTFIAVELTDDVRCALKDVQARLRAGGADVKWVEEENLHLTVKFLGEVWDERLPDVIATTRLAVASLPVFPVSLGGIGAFPSVTRPRVVWVGLQSGSEPFKRLMEQVEAAMAGLGFPREGRALHPHVTLGRVRDPRHLKRLPALLKAEPPETLGSLTVERLTIMSSLLSSKGPRYNPIGYVDIGK